MGKYIPRIMVIWTIGFLIWFNYVGIGWKKIESPDGNYTVKMSYAGLDGSYVRLLNKYGWPLSSDYYGAAIRDGIPFAAEWFQDAVAYIDHFDLGTSIKVLSLSNGKKLDFQSARALEVTEALRWKYSFTDFQNLLKEVNDKKNRAVYRIYTNPTRIGSVNQKNWPTILQF